MSKKFMLLLATAPLAALVACSSSDDAAAPDPAATTLDHVQTKGRTPGEAFIVHFNQPFDPETQYLSDYVIEEPWMDTGFTPENVHYVADGIELVLEKRQIGSQPYTGAEFQQLGFYGYGRYEVIMRGPQGDGVVSAFFTHTHELIEGDPHDEIDFEYLGKNSRQLHLNHFKDGKEAGSTYIDLPFDFSDAEHLYAFEWEPDAIRWYVDHELVYEAFDNIPDHSGRVIVSVIAFGEAAWDWTGRPDFEGRKVAFYRCMSHVPMGAQAGECSDYYPVGE